MEQDNNQEGWDAMRRENNGKKCLSWLTVVQLAVFGALLLTALIFKWIGGPFYQNIQSWYQTQAEDSILVDFTPPASSAVEDIAGGASMESAP